jgi:hypothetical protein
MSLTMVEALKTPRLSTMQSQKLWLRTSASKPSRQLNCAPGAEPPAIEEREIEAVLPPGCSAGEVVYGFVKGISTACCGLTSI